MTENIIHEIPVLFPYEPYPTQLAYMGKVIKALQNSENALLESPTGTGKTLCLLCATLAWRQQYKRLIELQNSLGDSQEIQKLQKIVGKTKTHKLPRIIFAARTHSQLTQTISELKKTEYHHEIKMGVLGSREQLCINNVVKNFKKNIYIQNKICRNLQKNHKCIYLENLDYFRKKSGISDKIMDIEDLVSFGVKNQVCPFYLSREMQKEADILFIPFQYLISPTTRKTLKIELEESIIIFDEAHNLEQICSDAASFEYTSQHSKKCLNEIDYAIKFLKFYQGNGHGIDKSLLDKLNEDRNERKDFSFNSEKSNSKNGDHNEVSENSLPTEEDLLILKTVISKIEQKIQHLSTQKELTQNGEFLYNLFAQVNITFQSVNVIRRTIHDALNLIAIQEQLEAAGKSSMYKPKYITGNDLQIFQDFLKILFSEDDEIEADENKKYPESISDYVVHLQFGELANKKRIVQNDRDNSNARFQNKEQTEVFTLNFYCFSPGVVMQQIVKKKPRTIVLTSGTLSPLESFEIEFKIPFQIQLEGEHVIDISQQAWIGALKFGPSGTNLNSSFKNRSNESYQNELGMSICRLVKIVPSGVLVFFPSFSVMNMCIKSWQKSSVWNTIVSSKKAFIEPTDNSTLSDVMDSYTLQNRNSKTGAIFFAVTRGKVSEGLDFADNNGRAVIITGVPFPSVQDPKVKNKKIFLDRRNYQQGNHGALLSGDEWFCQQASRAVNQAVGRIFRHKNDYGAIILCDERFCEMNNQRQLSKWFQIENIQENVKKKPRKRGQINLVLKELSSKIPDKWEEFSNLLMNAHKAQKTKDEELKFGLWKQISEIIKNRINIQNEQELLNKFSSFVPQKFRNLFN
ncbi:regulator of telomere elongation helicase 1 [Anaeramoeba ignava]|uniref:Regulator of telomere elongation helicase 1 homolog n=1 Tax=Anaeramoeba ignava TaxID=1746090 RepID=A0A9Q0LU76_ANAIG|nr:regulator of telomere elongation helicase 1 [Anaeramoeba ignava]